jgi:hypothetical protein
MRRAALLVLLAPIGCFSASSGGGSPDANFNTQMDAEFSDSGSGVDSSVDAAVDSSTNDVTVVEATVDAPVEASGPQPVTVLVTNALGPEPGVAVVFTDSNGTTEPIQTTSAAGTATSFTAYGGQATVVMGTSSNPYLFTVQGVAAGDTLAVYDPSVDLGYEGAGVLVSVDSWPDAAPPNTSQYEALLGHCDGDRNGPPVPVEIAPGCEAAGHTSVLLTALDVNGQPTGYTWQNNVALPPPDAGATVPVSLGNAWSTASDSITVNASGLPAFAAGMNGTILFTMVAGGVPTPAEGFDSDFGAPDSGASATFTFPTGYPDTVQTEANVLNQLMIAGQYIEQISAVATRSTTAPDSGVAVADLSQLLPLVLSASMDTTNVAQPIVTWTVADAGSIAGVSGVITSLVWKNYPSAGSWTIVAPPTATQVQPPALPAALSAWAPSSADQMWSPTVALVQASFLGGYAGLRAQAGTAGLTSDLIEADYSGDNGFEWGQPAVPPLPANGTLQMTAITASGD